MLALQTLITVRRGKYCLSNTVFPWIRKFFNTAMLQTSGLAVAEWQCPDLLYNPWSRAWDGNRAKADTPAALSIVPSWRSCPGLRGAWVAQAAAEPAAGWLSVHLHPLNPLKAPAALQPASSSRLCPVGSDAACYGEDEDESSQCQHRSVRATSGRPRQGTGRFPAFHGAGFRGFNYICGLDCFAWPLKPISQRAVLK